MNFENIICLNGAWNVVGTSLDGNKIEIKGNVPGSALNDVLLAENMEEDVFWRDNAEKYKKYETYTWVYSKKFHLEKEMAEAEIVFEKLDTYADVYINGKSVGKSDNAFIPFIFSANGILSEGENIIEVYFTSPVLSTKGKMRRECAFGSYERLYTRRPQCTYGWDWTMRFVTCGISGNVYIKPKKADTNVKSAYVYTDVVDEESALIGIDLELCNYEKGAVLDFEILNSDECLIRKISKYCAEEYARLYVDIKNPELWYPLGYGEQPLYKLKISQAGNELYSTVFGIRTVKIQELKDEEKSENYYKCKELKKTPWSEYYDKNEEFSGFILKVNGVKIMCKGANWVPCEPFSRRNTDEKVTKILETAKEAGVNMIRVWGGGDFETEHFYDECSRLGIMVTQDFLMACGHYPEDEQWFLEQLAKEAEYIVDKIRNKACLMWWSGDNENAIRGCDTDENYNGRASAYKAIAPVLYQKDYRRRFLPSSPYGGTFYASNTSGTTHNTQFLWYLFRFIEESDMNDYKEYFNLHNARFIAEEPCLGAVSEQTLKRFMTEEDIYGEDNKMWLYHTQSNPALKKQIYEYITQFAEKVFGKFDDGYDRLFKTQYLQYEWIRISLERVRREKWFCSGVIYWMLNDCWPASSGWAIIDYYGLPKAGYYSFKRCAKPVILSVDLENGEYKIHISNDSKEEKVRLKWYMVSNDGKIVSASEDKEIIVKTNSSMVALTLKESEIKDDCFIVAEIVSDNGIYDKAFYKKGRLEIKPCADRIDLLTEENGTVTVKANAYVHAVKLCGEGVFSDNFFSLLPGEEKTLKCDSLKTENVRVVAYTI